MANEFFTDEYTAINQKIVQEIVNDPDTYLGSKYMPSVTVPQRKIRVEVIEATGGLTNEHVPGTDPKYVQSFGWRVQEYAPPAYKESILYDEEKILYLRELGQADPSRRGITDYMDKSIKQLNRRLEARIELLRWQTIFNGGFSYLGKTLSFGIPTANRAVPIGAVWSTNGISANNTADPIVDLRYWLMSGYAPYRKYKFTGIVMNGNTARWILDNTNTRAYLTSYGANPNMNKYDLNQVLGFLIPGLPPVTVYNGWYQTETIVNQKITVSDAIYFIPDGFLFFETSLPDNDVIGEFVQGVNLASGTIETPGVGKFLVVEECIAPGTRGGPKNPFIDITAGVYGGPKLDRAFDTLTAKVIA
jgi:hypothetical protein